MEKEHPIYTELAECQDCYKCVRACPVKAIRIQDGHAVIIPERCILCGNCVSVCPIGAKRVRNDIEKVKAVLSQKEQVFVSLAPSYTAEFLEVPMGNLLSALKRLGFSGVSETALGAEEVSANVAGFLKDFSGTVFSTACPVFVEYVKKYAVELLPRLTPFLSPVLSHCKILKRIYGEDIGIVFIGPCIAKKKESDDHPKLLDAALTFEELRVWLEQEGIDVRWHPGEEAGFVPFPAQEGRYYPIEGGMLNTVKYKCSVDDPNMMAITGVSDMINVCKSPRDIEAEDIFVEVLACEGGCINGPCVSSKQERDILRRRLRVLNSVEVKKGKIPGQPKVDIHEDFPVEKVELPEVPEEEIHAAMRKVGKITQKDELNCGGCGYNTCREFALALIRGDAEPTMCVSYMRKLAQKKANALMEKIPCGVVIVDEELKILECNRKFAELIDEIYLFEATALEGAILEKLVPFYRYFQPILDGRLETTTRDVQYKNRVLNLLFFSIEQGRVVGCIIRDITEPLIRNDEIIRRTKEAIRKNLSTVQKVAYMMGENAAEVESILNSIVDAFAPSEIESGDDDE